MSVHWEGMTRITIELPDDLADRVNTAATERSLAPAELAREALAKQFPPPRPLTFIGIGASGGEKATSEGHKETRRAHFANKAASDV